MQLLLLTLSVAANKFAPGVECLIVDDSEVADAEEIRSACAMQGARYVRGPRLVGAKRNLGVALAKGPVVLFIDSDVSVSSDVLQHHWRAYEEGATSVGAVAGPTFSAVTNTLLNRAMRQSSWLTDLEWPRIALELGWATTSNLSVRVRAFQAVGGFSEKPLTVVAGEDVDFGLRLTDAGWRIVCDPAAEAFHGRENSDDLARVLRRLFTYGRSGQWLCVVHPTRRKWKFNRATFTLGMVAASSLIKCGPARHSVMIIAPAVIATIISAVSRTKRLNDLGPAVFASALEFSAEVGEFVAALELKSPKLVMMGFGWTDSPHFKWRAPSGL